MGFKRPEPSLTRLTSTVGVRRSCKPLTGVRFFCEARPGYIVPAIGRTKQYGILYSSEVRALAYAQQVQRTLVRFQLEKRARRGFVTRLEVPLVSAQRGTS